MENCEIVSTSNVPNLVQFGEKLEYVSEPKLERDGAYRWCRSEMSSLKSSVMKRNETDEVEKVGKNP